MKFWLAVGSVLIAQFQAGAALAQTLETDFAFGATPQQFVSRVLAKLSSQDGGPAFQVESVFDPILIAIAERGRDVVGKPGFSEYPFGESFISDSQDPYFGDLVVDGDVSEADSNSATVYVGFTTYDGREIESTYYLTLWQTGWRISDICFEGGATCYRGALLDFIEGGPSY